MKKRRYQPTPVKELRLEPLLRAAGDKPGTIGIDIAKEDMFAAFQVGEVGRMRASVAPTRARLASP